MSNFKATLYIFSFFSVIILGVVGTSVYFLHEKQVAQGTLTENTQTPDILAEQDALKNSNDEIVVATPEKITQTVQKDTTVVTNTLSQVAKHNTESNCWLVISNKIYNVTSFLSSHPGGVSAITSYCGKDATTAFKTHGMSGGSNHSAYAYSLLPTYYVGVLNAISASTQTQTVPTKTTTQTTPVQITKTPVSSRFTVGDRVQAIANLNVRNIASATGSLLGTQSTGDAGSIIAGATFQGNFFWWKVDFDSGVDGWVVEDYLDNYVAPVNKPTVVVPNITPATGSSFTSTQVSTHNTQSNCWIIILGKVYNVTSFMSVHPGGVNAILSRCGTDATTVFTTSAGHVHSSYAYSLLPTYYIGDIGTAVVPVVTDTSAPTTPTGLIASTISSSQINLSWTASTDNNAVVGYYIYRGGVQIGTSGSTSYSDTGLSASTAYTYTVSAYDASGNISSQSISKSATTNAQAVTPTLPSSGTTYTTTQVSTHNIQSDCWIIILGKVYNVTSFMSVHPGGVSAIRTRCGTDATTVFTTSAGHVHSSYAYSLLPTYYIGDVGTVSTPVTPTPTPTPVPTPTPTGTTGTPTTYTVNVNSSGNYDVTSLTIKVGDTINFVYTPPRSGEVRTSFSPSGVSSVTVDSEITQKSRTFNSAGTWTFKAADHSGNTGTVVVQ